ncbi:MAG: hypothetical protein A3G33_10725 [Omnitrophica bacterium RIFCSPLOWO2_12_FULL_44_17]|uniref:PilZ domain-containing protein n=1 Tax=Candidatus Danuiimicrobium aquiferis TaxID=1801832 RepID=A0A1G1KRK9_9BACT|nr:MAG: hypothetical protein A3G33_10725 [Omnitrophica bacterium RIFCSPLOWO2_12_FULL_44_17]OGX03322.1 MAG: hypothetical protein A3J12_07360 [Omnitrophica bacterium RIFCSPLOWO2_02_FULL_44_11]
MDSPESSQNPHDLPRDQIRIPAGLKAKYQQGDSEPHEIKIQNISRGGICMEDQVLLPEGTCLHLLLKIKEKVVDAYGEVSWSEKQESGFLHGIKFTFMDQDSREWLNAFVMDWAAEYIAESLDFSDIAEMEIDMGIECDSTVERRHYARLRLPLRVDFSFSGTTKFVQTQTHDLSEGGLCFTCGFNLRKDQELHLWLWLSATEEIHIRGIVRHTSKRYAEGKTIYFHGVEFLIIEDSSRSRFSEFLAQKRSELAAIEVSLDDIISQGDRPELP